MKPVEYTARLVDPIIAELISELPALLLTGPRATGKTTTARRHAETVVRLDSEAEAGAFRADPDAALRSLPEPVLLDEWQQVPGVLGAVKRAVDNDSHPGRFILTGSVRGDLEAPMWPGTGRLVRLTMYGLTQRELHGAVHAADFIDRLATADLSSFPSPPDPPDLRHYIEMAVAGGFPDATLGLAEASRERWLDSYLDQLITRDAVEVAHIRDPSRLRRCVEALALNSAGQTTEKSLYDAAGINRRTYVAYEQLLQNLMVLDVLPAWTTNRISRLARAPKRYLTDPSLMATALRLDVNGVLRDSDLLGRVLDTFALSQLRPEVELSAKRPRLHHLRQEDGRREVDLIVELGGQDVIGIEVKADAAPAAHDARHLGWLRDTLGPRFIAGAVLHTGPRSYALSDRIFALPLASLWNAPQPTERTKSGGRSG